MFSLVFSSVALAILPQQPTCAPLSGTIQDQTSALISGAEVRLDARKAVLSSADGSFRIPCVALGKHRITASASSFEVLSREVIVPMLPSLVLKLRPETVETNVSVSGSDESASSTATHTLSGSRLQTLADDPDDLLRELQQLASSVGANPSSVTIAVDGFQDSTALPPKESIESITIDPDLYSAEYGHPPYNGGRVEVRTKPGQKTFHGSLFLTNGSPFENARDPFSVSKAAIGKQRYGGQLTGPITRAGSDFSLGLEYRRIDNFAVVNAITLDGAGNLQATVANVPASQRLWLPTARLDWQLGAKNNASASFTGLSNTLQNVGAGGLSLAETGYRSQRYDNVLRFIDYTTMNPKSLLESRVSLRWDGETDTPNSTDVQVQVAGAFNAGGSTLGYQRLHEFQLESDDNLLLNLGHHTIKAGLQMTVSHENDSLTTQMNGTYLFGGGTAPVLSANGSAVPGSTETISGLEQYRRSLLHLPGGTPSTFEIVSGSPALAFTQFSNALFAQDEWDATKQLHVSLGLRYYAQTQPTMLRAITPRIGLAWSPGEHSRWTLHAHAGLFGSTFSPAQQTEVLRLDGQQRNDQLVYDPVYGNPLVNAQPINTIHSFSPTFTSGLSITENVGGTYNLPFGWQLSADLSFGRITNADRDVNVNAPFGSSPYGTRPGSLYLNNLQEQNSAQGRLNIEFLGFSQQGWKWAQLFFGAVRIDRVDDAATPQDARSDAGEFARPDGQPLYQAFGNGLFHLPKGIEFSSNLYVAAGAPYNLLTGYDNNGDGVFNDRPQYATSAQQPGAIETPYGLLVSSGGSAYVPRNRGTLPTTLFLDVNLERRFKLFSKPGEQHGKSITLNVRSSNVTNHLNTTMVGNILGSPLFNQPYAADNGRRVEAGIRYSF